MKEPICLTPLALNPIFIFIAFVYTSIFLAGLVNLGLFSIRKLRGLPLFSPARPEKKFPLDKENSLKLILLIILLALLTYILPVLFSAFDSIKPIYLILGSNLLLQLGSIFLILKYIDISFFDLSTSKKELDFVLRVYSAAVPVIIALLLTTLFFIEVLGIELKTSPLEQIIPLIDTKTVLFVFIFQAVLIVPLAEEFVFRGLFYKLLRKKYSFLLSAVSLSLFFSLLHRTPAGFLSLFGLSFVICYVYEKTQKLSAAFILHALHNLITLLFFLGTR